VPGRSRNRVHRERQGDRAESFQPSGDAHSHNGSRAGAIDVNADAQTFHQPSGGANNRPAGDPDRVCRIAPQLDRGARPFMSRRGNHIAPVEREGHLDCPEHQKEKDREREHGFNRRRTRLVAEALQQPIGPHTVSRAVWTIATRRPRATVQIATTRALVINTMSTPCGRLRGPLWALPTHAGSRVTGLASTASIVRSLDRHPT
jgi:hypothetical protein